MASMRVIAPGGDHLDIEALSIEQAIAKTVTELDLPRRTLDNRLIVWGLQQNGTLLRTGTPTDGTWTLVADLAEEAIAAIDTALDEVRQAVTDGTVAETPHLMTKLTLLQRTGAHDEELARLDEAIRSARRDDTRSARSRQRSALALPLVAALGVVAVGALVFISVSGNVDRPDPVFEPSVIEALPAVIDGEIAVRGEVDRFELDLESGEAIEVSLIGQSAFQQMDTELRVIGPGGNEVAYNDDFNGLNSRLVHIAAESGTYVIEAGGLGGCCVGTYQLTVDPIDAAGLEAVDLDVELPYEGDGVIGLPGVYDRYRVTLAAGEALSAQAFGGVGGFGGQFDMEMRIYDEDFFELAYNDDWNSLDPRIDLIAATDGVYIVEVGGLGGQNTGSYRIQIDAIDAEDVEDGPFFGDGGDVGGFSGDDFLDVSQDVDFGTYEGAIDSFGEYDEYAIELAEGEGITVSLDATGDQTLDPLLRVLDESGAIIAENDDFNGLNSRIELVAPQAGVYLIRAVGLGGGSIGQYVLTIEATGSVSPPTTLGAASSSTFSVLRSELVAIPYETEGELGGFGVADEYLVELNAGDSILVSAEALESYEGLFDLELVIGDPSDSQVATNDDRGDGSFNPQLTYTAVQSGTHVVQVRALAGATTGVYLLTIETG